MTRRVLNLSKTNCLVETCSLATNFWSRGKGLLGTKALEPDTGLWIANCNSIHTLFMNYPIDCVFVDKKFVVKAIRHNVVPWRWVPPVWRAKSVFELPSGTAALRQVDVGDQLNVVD